MAQLDAQMKHSKTRSVRQSENHASCREKKTAKAWEEKGHRYTQSHTQHAIHRERDYATDTERERERERGREYLRTTISVQALMESQEAIVSVGAS